MSLIEQAARRLEELRRAGVEVGPGDGGAAIAPFPGEPPLAPPLRPGGPPHGAPDVLVRDARERVPSGARTTRRVEIDAATLRANGFAAPSDARSQLADEFRVVKRPILANATGRGVPRVRDGNLVMVTSALPGEGKTFVAVNLALSIAMEVDHRVLLVDADVTRPSLPAILGIPTAPGLLDLLRRPPIPMHEALVATSIDRLTLLPAGTPDARATELLASAQMASLAAELASRYADRIVVFDAPPILGAPETRVLASRVGQVLVVVAADETPKPAVEQALESIESCEVVLTLLNKSPGDDLADYYYGHHAGDAD